MIPVLRVLFAGTKCRDTRTAGTLCLLSLRDNYQRLHLVRRLNTYCSYNYCKYVLRIIVIIFFFTYDYCVIRDASRRRERVKIWSNTSNMLIKFSKQIANTFAKIFNGYNGEFKTLSNI